MTADAREIRVFHVLGSLITGGPERLVLDLCRFAPLNAIDATIVSLGPPQGHVFEQTAADQGIRVIYLDKPPGFHPPVITTLYRLFRTEQPDIVHTHAYLLPYALPAMFLNRLPGRVHTIHNLADKEAGYVIRRIMALAYRFLGVTPVAISHQVKASIMAEYALESSRIPCIHNGIDTTSFTRIPRCSGTPIRFVHVGRMSRQKNQELLIEAFADAVRINPDITLRLVGDGELKPAILERIRARGCERWVRHAGLRGDIQAELNKAAVFILSSAWEGLSLSVLEAMSCGLPVIATRVGGTPEIVLDHQTGILVNPGDREALTRAILALAGDAALRERLGQRAHELSRGYDIRDASRKYAALYRRLIVQQDVNNACNAPPSRPQT